MYMWEEAGFISVLGTDVYAWGMFAAIGALAMLLLLCAMGLAKKMLKGAVPVTFLLGVFLGAICSKIFFALFSFNVDVPFFGKMLPQVFTGGGHSMFGALVGSFAGAVIAARLMKQNPLDYADAFSVAALGFVFFARLGEMHVEDFGISRPLTHPFSAHLPAFLLQEGDYANYLPVYKLEAIAAALILVVLLLDLLLHKNAKPGDTFILFLLLFGGSQAILESLRQDKHLTLSFVHLQQIMAIPMLVAGVIMAAVRAKKDKRFMYILSGCLLGAVVLGVLLELTIYRPDMTLEMDIYLIYTLFAVLVAALVYVGLRLRKGGSLIPWKKRK